MEGNVWVFPYSRQAKCANEPLPEYTKILFLQVLEKKVKKVAEMNLESSSQSCNGASGGSQLLNSRSSTPWVENGSLSQCVGPTLSNDFVFPPDGISSLHLPTVVVFTLQPLFVLVVTLLFLVFVQITSLTCISHG